MVIELQPSDLEDMMTDREQRIRERAHQFWEEEGRPEGREQEHWERAVHEINDESENSDHPELGVDTQQEPTGGVGTASVLQPGGTTPGGGPGAGAGSVGTGGGSTGGASTGSPRKAGR